MSEKQNLRKILLLVLAGAAAVLLLVWWIAGDAFYTQKTASTPAEGETATGEITAEVSLAQTFVCETDWMTGIGLAGGNFEGLSSGALQLVLKGEDGIALAAVTAAPELFDTEGYHELRFAGPVSGVKGKHLSLEVTSPGTPPGQGVTLFYGSSIRIGRGSVPLQIPEEERLRISGVPTDGRLCFIAYGENGLWLGPHYFLVAGGVLLVLALVALWILRREAQGHATGFGNLVRAARKYRFLIRQLVQRDFKRKYRRSALGIVWSFLNPLLTMLVQYVVFSTLFRSSIEHYPVYLLSGIVLFNFFSEMTNSGMNSITDNASLITKVSVPKYIYPVTRVLSAAVNVMFSLIPLFLVAILTGLRPSWSWLLIVLGLVSLMAFSLGVVFVLATMMTYFRDTQFLWGVLSMIWMYLTPIFYPESIIPARLISLYHCNPLYQIITFVRTALIDGVSPAPRAYVILFLIGIVPLAAGAWIFHRKEQDLVLHL